MDGVRLNIRTPWRFIYIALTPGARIQKGRWQDNKWVYVLMEDPRT